MIELKKVNNEGKEIRPMPAKKLINIASFLIGTSNVFEAVKRLCEMSGSVTITQDGMEITFKKTTVSCEQ